MKFRKIGTWSVNKSGPSGNEGLYVEADLPSEDPFRYAAINPSYAGLWEKDIGRLNRGEWVEIPAIERGELTDRIDKIDLQH